MIGRFIQEDTYLGDGLNLFAYCQNNPLVYWDPSGHWCENKEKALAILAKYVNDSEEEYQNIKERLGISDKKGSEYAELVLHYVNANYEDNILHKPIYDWTDEELQRAVDSVHNSVYGKEGLYPGKGGANPFSLIVSKDGFVVLSSKNQYPTGSEKKMNEIFGEGNYELVNGSKKSDYNISPGVELMEGGLTNHAEARAVQRMKDLGGKVEGSKEVCSHLSCESCTEIMYNEGINQITPSVKPGTKTMRGRYSRAYVDNLY